MSFNHFDSLVRANEFWSIPVDRLNQNLERNHKKDSLQRAGISAVVGAPLSQEIQEKIRLLEQAFEQTLTALKSNIQIEWRKKYDALHFSVYGLIMPDDYEPTSWPLQETQLSQIKDALDSVGNFELQLQGIGILGMGAVSVRVSDSPELEQLRNTIGAIPGFSQERFGSRTKKIVIGRIRPPLISEGREVIKKVCDDLKDFSIGKLPIHSLEIIHYQNTFLEAEFDRIHIA